MDVVASPIRLAKRKRANRPFMVPEDIASLRDRLTREFGNPGWPDIARQLRARLVIYKMFGYKAIASRETEGMVREYTKHTHCKRGHALVPNNVYQRVTPAGYVQRKCKICRRHYDRYERKRRIPKEITISRECDNE